MNIKDVKKYSKIENNIKIIKIAEGKIIKVIKYLPCDQKMGFVMDVLNRCVEDGRILPVAVDIVTYMNFVTYYTDLEIDYDNDMSVFEAYDILEQTGLLKRILENIPQDELDVMFEYIGESISNAVKRDNSIGGGLGEISQMVADTTVPELTEAIKEVGDKEAESNIL